MYVNRTLILPAAHAPLARALAAHLAGPPGEGMWVVGLSPTGEAPATHYVSSGPVGAEFDAMLTDADALWGAVQMSAESGLKSVDAITRADCVALVEAAEVVDLDDEPVFDTLWRLDLELVTNDAPR